MLDLALLAALAPTAPSALGEDPLLPALSRDDLARGALVSGSFEARPLDEVLAAIADQTGNPTDPPFGMDEDGSWHSERAVTVQLEERPYWDALDAVAAAAGLHCTGIFVDKGALADKPTPFDNQRLLAAPRNAGAFRLTPILTDFQLELGLDPEPRVRVAAVRSCEVRIGDATFSTGADDWDQRVSALPMGSSVDLSVPKRSFEGEAEADLSVALEVEVVTRWERVDAGPVGELAGGGRELAGVRVRLERIEAPEPDGDDDPGTWGLHFVVGGGGTVMESAALVAPDGERVEPTGRATSGTDEQSLQLYFPAGTFEVAPETHVLVLDLPAERTEWPLSFEFPGVDLSD